ncbi:hypothetical protein AOC36_04335 [Erysipelothrix larvae]|uniref:Uncharacterized protein n=1 Tax=Erysipelothrix larvae TaxID=1514105 RepID=A0A109UGU7_9FIRM|nr:hypothetical protein [Erysipelothrix larvae]AMC93226.1 hypothetical protein AOC36_04335 [Erysipelothrix larvae]
MRDKLIGNLILVVILVSCIILTSILSFALFLPEGISLTSLIVETLPIFGSYYFIAILFLVLGSGLSMILDASISITGVAMGVVFIPYVVAVMASLIDSLKPLKAISILHTLMPHEIYANNVSLISIALWILVVLGVFIIGMQRFKRRDILV